MVDHLFVWKHASAHVDWMHPTRICMRIQRLNQYRETVLCGSAKCRTVVAVDLLEDEVESCVSSIRLFLSFARHLEARKSSGALEEAFSANLSV